VCTDKKSERYRLSEKGQVTAERRNAALRVARAARRAYRNSLVIRANQSRSIGFDGKYSGPTPTICRAPRIGELKLTDFMAVLHV
jgi:hypothetical protein